MLAAAAAQLDLAPLLATFQREGWVRLGRMLTDEGLDALRTRADEIMTAQVRYPEMFFQRDAESGRYDDLEFGKGWQGPSLAYRKIEKLELDPRFFQWLSNPLFGRVARTMIADEVALYRAVLFTKSAAGGTALPWHQDGGIFWGVDRDPTLQIWTALDDCPVEAGCLEVLPRSHLGGLATPQGGVIPDGELARAQAVERALALPAVAGEVLLIHNHVWHRSGVNHTGRPRRALSVCLMSAQTRCLRRKRAPRQFRTVFPG